MANNDSLVLLPGQLCDSALWQYQARAIGSRVDIMIADLTRDDSIGAMASRVLDIAPPCFALAGLSLGGYVAFEILRRAPGRVTRLTLMNTSARADADGQAGARETSIRASRIGAFKGVTPRFLPSILHPAHVADPEISGIVLAMTERVGRVAFERQQVAAIGRPDSRTLLPGISCPTLVIGGRQDTVTPPPLQAEIAAAIPGARLHTLDICGHLAPLERADAVNRLMLAWLEA
jgi:pimeloyl-ACP methyl ester carboxylesterase